jgi:O-antigen ligase
MHSQRKISSSFVFVSLIVAGASALGMKLFHFTPLVLGIVPLLVCGVLRPQLILVAAMTLAPFTASLTGENLQDTSSVALFGVSDILLLIAIPGFIVQAAQRANHLSLGKMAVPTLGFLGVGLLSFYLNLGQMHHLALNYFAGFMRTAQVLLFVPLTFAVCDWDVKEVRMIVRGYILGVSFMAFVGVLAFAAGTRNGLYILGCQKNLVGLALAMGALLAIAALTHTDSGVDKNRSTPPETLGFTRGFLAVVAVLCSVALLFSLSRGAWLGMVAGLIPVSLMRRRGAVFAGILLAIAIGLFVVQKMLPDEAAEYMTDISANRLSNYDRIDRAQAAWRRFQSSPYVGDGFRARRDFLPHNLEATLLAENGAIGTLLFAWILVAMIRICLVGRRTFAGDPLRETLAIMVVSSLVCIVAQSQFDPFWRRGPLWIPWAGAGLMVAMLKNEAEGQRQRRKRVDAEAEREYWLRRAEARRQRLERLRGAESTQGEA